MSKAQRGAIQEKDNWQVQKGNESLWRQRRGDREPHEEHTKVGISEPTAPLGRNKEQ